MDADLEPCGKDKPQQDGDRALATFEQVTSGKDKPQPGSIRAFVAFGLVVLISVIVVFYGVFMTHAQQGGKTGGHGSKKIDPKAPRPNVPPPLGLS